MRRTWIDNGQPQTKRPVALTLDGPHVTRASLGHECFGSTAYFLSPAGAPSAGAAAAAAGSSASAARGRVAVTTTGLS